MSVPLEAHEESKITPAAGRVKPHSPSTHVGLEVARKKLLEASKHPSAAFWPTHAEWQLAQSGMEPPQVTPDGAATQVLVAAFNTNGGVHTTGGVMHVFVAASRT